MNPSEHPAAALAPVSRRRFLRLAMWGAASVTAAGAGLVAVLRRSPVDDVPVPATIHYLSAAEYHLFARAMPVLLPVTGTALPSLQQVPVLQTIDAMIGLLSPAVRKELGAGLALFDHAALVSGWHGKRFVDLDDEAVRDYFERWAHGNSIQKALATVVKKFVYVAYWRDPRTWPAIEFDGPVSDRWGIASLGNTPLPDESREESRDAGANA